MIPRMLMLMLVMTKCDVKHINAYFLIQKLISAESYDIANFL